MMGRDYHRVGAVLVLASQSTGRLATLRAAGVDEVTAELQRQINETYNK